MRRVNNISRGPRDGSRTNRLRTRQHSRCNIRGRSGFSHSRRSRREPIPSVAREGQDAAVSHPSHIARHGGVSPVCRLRGAEDHQAMMSVWGGASEGRARRDRLAARSANFTWRGRDAPRSARGSPRRCDVGCSRESAVPFSKHVMEREQPPKPTPAWARAPGGHGCRALHGSAAAADRWWRRSNRVRGRHGTRGGGGARAVGAEP